MNICLSHLIYVCLCISCDSDELEISIEGLKYKESNTGKLRDKKNGARWRTKMLIITY